MTTNSGKKRVIALLNAIGDLHEGDLKAVLESDGVVFENLKTLWSAGQNDYICLDEDNPWKIKVIRGSRPPAKSLRDRAETGEQLGHVIRGSPPTAKSLLDRAETGEQLGHILEQQLINLLAFGEWFLPSWGKDRGWKWLLPFPDKVSIEKGGRLGGRHFTPTRYR
jgi:hypothetical protein